MHNSLEMFRNKKILIWGYGREGQSTESFLKKHNICKEIKIYEGKKDEELFNEYDYIFKSPGIVCFDDNPRFMSQTQVFMQAFRDKTIGITGTKGKSTTSAMLHKALAECSEKDAILLGNIGKPCLDYFDDVTDNSVIIFELSCHQLAQTKVSPHIAVLLNLFEEHLDYYETVERYYAAKLNVTAFQDEADYVYLGEQVADTKSKACKVVVTSDEQFDLKILGNHNQINANFVMKIACDRFGCDKAKVKESIEAFAGLDHRLQKIGCVDGVDYYDDSISTIPNATIGAVESIKNVKTVLVGGMDRGIDYTALIEFIPTRKDVLFILMYESGKRIYEALASKDNVVYVDDLQEAVSVAKLRTVNGDACVMSPAAPSYGYFKNFEERGEVFKQLVLDK